MSGGRKYSVSGLLGVLSFLGRSTFGSKSSHVEYAVQAPLQRVPNLTRLLSLTAHLPRPRQRHKLQSIQSLNPKPVLSSVLGSRFCHRWSKSATTLFLCICQHLEERPLKEKKIKEDKRSNASQGTQPSEVHHWGSTQSPLASPPCIEYDTPFPSLSSTHAKLALRRL